MTDTDLYGRGTATLLASFEAYARGARTVEHARRRGLGTALTALHLHDARSRGCRTASVQSTARAERL